MSITADMLREAFSRKAKMSEYPEGNDVCWKICEWGLALFCAAAIVICILIACGVK